MFNALVTDTHPLVFHATGGRDLGCRAAAHFAACESQEAILYVPTVVIWECCLLVQAGKINLQPSPRRFFNELFANPAYQPFDLTPDQVHLAYELRPNRR